MTGGDGKMADFNRARYNAYDNVVMTERRKRINEMSQEEVMAEWDRITRAICKNCGLKRKDM